MKSRSVAVLVTCFNRRDKTVACLENLYKQEGADSAFSMQVFLVDDGSTDGTAAAVLQKFPDVKIITGTGNLFWNRGMHLAWSEALKIGYDFYLWLNDDTMLYTTCLAELLKCSSEVNDQSIICGSTCSAVGGQATYGGITHNKELIKPNGKPQLCAYFNGNCILVPKYVSDIVGNLDDKFHHTIGDYDYGKRAAKKGIKSYVSYGFIGTCEKHETMAKWCSPAEKLADRIKAFKSPLAVNPALHFRYDYRHRGLPTAVIHFITIYLRLLFPSLWQARNKARKYSR